MFIDTMLSRIMTMYTKSSILCQLNSGLFRAAVPSGASTGVYEALELRDKDPAEYLGKGMFDTLFGCSAYGHKFNVYQPHVSVGVVYNLTFLVYAILILALKRRYTV